MQGSLLFSRYRAPDDVQRSEAGHAVDDGGFFGEVYIALQRTVIACVQAAVWEV